MAYSHFAVFSGSESVGNNKHLP